MVNTRQVTNRRPLRFANFGAVVRDAESLAGAERRGTLRAMGNWTLGQAIGHLAYWARAPLVGYPELPRPPWLLRVMMPLLKNGFLNKRLPAGVRIRGVADGTLGTEKMATDRALGELRAALDRWANETPSRPNPILGTLTHGEWIKLNLRHAELHLSFFHPG